MAVFLRGKLALGALLRGEVCAGVDAGRGKPRPLQRKVSGGCAWAYGYDKIGGWCCAHVGDAVLFVGVDEADGAWA